LLRVLIRTGGPTLTRMRHREDGTPCPQRTPAPAWGDSMAISSNTDDLDPALDLTSQPLLLEALLAIDQGKAPEDALCG
jgi:hypothetical protein